MIRFTTLASLAALLVASPALAQEAIFPRGVEEIQIDSPASVVGVTATAGGGRDEGFIEDGSSFRRSWLTSAASRTSTRSG